MVLWMLVQAVALATPGCESEGRLRLHCAVRGGKEVRICEEAGRLVYRFGPPERVEMTVLGGTLAHHRTGPDAERHVASFWTSGHRYAVAVDRTEDQFEARVVVRKGAKQLTTLACTEPLSVDFTETRARFAGEGAAPSSWIGHWDRGGDAELHIVAEGDQLVVEKGLAIFMMGPDRAHTGEVKGVLASVDAHTRRVRQDDCQLTLKWAGPDRLRAEDNGRCGGLNVRFDGDFTRLP